MKVKLRHIQLRVLLLYEAGRDNARLNLLVPVAIKYSCLYIASISTSKERAYQWSSNVRTALYWRGFVAVQREYVALALVCTSWKRASAVISPIAFLSKPSDRSFSFVAFHPCGTRRCDRINWSKEVRFALWQDQMYRNVCHLFSFKFFSSYFLASSGRRTSSRPACTEKRPAMRLISRIATVVNGDVISGVRFFCPVVL